MAYRGEDLDLRTPMAHGTRSSEASPSGGLLNGLRRAEYGDRPIVVDDAVMACCNYAHEIATAHRAGEVRLEHLIYAMTRVENAVPVLEDRGTRVIALRGEALGLIAAAPQTSNGLVSPRKSGDLEDVLRYAAELAARRGHGAATVEDLLIALIDARADHPATVLLRRHMPRRVLETSYQSVRTEAPPLIRNGGEPERERTRVRVNTAPLPEPARALSTDQLLGTTTDSIQNTRIDALEKALRQLSSQLTSERGALSAMLQNIQRDVGRTRDDDLGYGGAMQDRIAAIEASLDLRLGDLTRALGTLQDRLETFDAGSARPMPDLSRALALLEDRLGKIEAALQRTRPDVAGPLSTLEKRLAAIETALQRSRPETGVDFTGLQDRLASVERIVQTSAGDNSRGWATLADRIKSLEQGLSDGGSLDIGLPAVTSRLDTIEKTLQSGIGAAIDASPIASRLDTIEQIILEQVGEPAADSSAIAGRLSALETGLTQQREEMRRAVGQASENLDRRIAQLSETITGRLSETVDPGKALAPLNERMAGIERNLTAYAEKLAEHSNGYDQDLGEIQDVLIKLHGNQQTMTTSLDQWRQQGHNELGVIGNRLSAIERIAARPTQILEGMTTRMDALYHLTSQKIERRNKFVYWLFGTNDWLAASWPDRANKPTSGTTTPTV